MIDLEKEKNRYNKGIKNNFEHTVEYNTKEECKIVDELKNNMMLLKTDRQEYFYKDGAAQERFRVIRNFVNYLNTTKKIYDPDYFIDFFIWYINFTQVEGWNYFEIWEEHNIETYEIAGRNYASFKKTFQYELSYKPEELVMGKIKGQMLDLIITVYLKKILELNPDTNLDKFYDYLISISYKYDQCYYYILYCLTLITEFKSHYTKEQIQKVENMILNLKFETRMHAGLKSYDNEAMPLYYIGNVPFYKFIRYKMYPEPYFVEKEINSPIHNYNDYTRLSCGSFRFYSSEPIKTFLPFDYLLTTRDYVPSLCYRFVKNISDENLYKHLDLILEIESPRYCYKFLEEFDLTEEYQQKILDLIYGYDLKLYKKAIDMLSEKYKNNPEPTSQKDEIDYTKEIEKIRNMNILDIIDLLSKDELIYLQQLLKTDKPKIDDQTKSLIKKLMRRK